MIGCYAHFISDYTTNTEDGPPDIPLKILPSESSSTSLLSPTNDGDDVRSDELTGSTDSTATEEKSDDRAETTFVITTKENEESGDGEATIVKMVETTTTRGTGFMHLFYNTLVYFISDQPKCTKFAAIQEIFQAVKAFPITYWIVLCLATLFVSDLYTCTAFLTQYLYPSILRLQARV